MPHDIDRILEAARASVWLIDEDKAREIVTFLSLRAAGETAGWSEEAPAPVYALDPVQGRHGNVHHLVLHGVLTPRAGMMTRMSGAASLEQFGRAFAVAANDPNCQAIVIDIDSPGGDVSLVEETAGMIYRSRREGRPIIAVANTIVASAAYWIASAADEIVVTPSGQVGSIGVYSMHDDLTAAMNKAGLKRDVIKAGPRKAEGLVGGLDEAARAHRQRLVDETYGAFVTAVARNRNVDAATVRADPEETERHFGGGRSYRAKTALRLGMADRIATLDETLARSARGRRSRQPRVARARLNLTT